MRSYFPFLFLVALFAVKAEGRLLIEGMMGTAYSFPSTLSIYQENQPTLRFRGTWSNEPLSPVPYYSFRVGGWTESSGWEFEHLHHKVVLNNNPPEVQSFKATFGFNLFLINRAWDLGWFILRVGVGPVIGHPITTVRGQPFNSVQGGLMGTTYYLVGAGAQISVQRRFYLGDHFFLSVEGKVTAASANLPVANGTSEMPNTALHGQAGLGYRF